jgi:hypothetical protein
VTSQALSQVIQKARDQAKQLLSALERTGHPQTNESSGLYLALVTMQKRLAQGAAVRPAELAAELEQLAGMCKGKLEPLKALFDEALRISRGTRT